MGGGSVGWGQSDEAMEEVGCKTPGERKHKGNGYIGQLNEIALLGIFEISIDCKLFFPTPPSLRR